ncbi:MAG: peptide chain release factor 2 [Chloroflexota bacterium]|nr:MAG: peptide chain release factor 2 [Chloroflexota bacterium]
MDDIRARLNELERRVRELRCDFDVAGQEKLARELEDQAVAPDFWSDPVAAQAHMRRLNGLVADVDQWRTIGGRIAEAGEYLELAEAEPDDSAMVDVERDVAAIEDDLGRIEFELIFSGPYDGRSAIIAIHAGAGGTESQDWAEMLMRMYLRWSERQGYKTEMLDFSPGEEAGIKSVTLEVVGIRAYGQLKAEHGVHRLVRLSPYDAAHRRHTSFALVEVMPEVEAAAEVQIGPDDVRMDVFRSSGAGGQNVQKTSTAVRLTHIPTGIVVTCQNERSQIQNRESAMKILMARLIAMEAEKRDREQTRLKGEHKEAGWGNQIRSYVLHPYNMVKDHRTDFETSNTGAVLDGEIGGFIESYLRSRVGATAA